MADFFRKVKEGVEKEDDDIFHKNKDHGQTQDRGPHDAPTSAEEDRPAPKPHVATNHRFSSFAPQSTGHAKWFVDGASYFWAVSIALQGR